MCVYVCVCVCACMCVSEAMASAQKTHGTHAIASKKEMISQEFIVKTKILCFWDVTRKLLCDSNLKKEQQHIASQL